MMKNFIKNRWPIIVLAIIFFAIIVLTAISLSGNRMLDKYVGKEGFEQIKPTFEDNFEFIKQNPNNDSAYYSLGQGFYSLKGYDDAIWAFSEAVKINPKLYYYWINLANAYQAKKDYISARDAYIKGLGLEPNKPAFYTALAWLYYFRLEPEKDKAFEVLKRGLEKFPDDKAILFDITRYYLYDKNKEEFLKYAPKYIKLDSANEAINNGLKEWGKGKR